MSKYSLTNHALDRIATRFGIKSHKASEWVNNIMRTAKYVHSQPDGKLVYDSEGNRIIVSATDNRVITVFPQVTLDFLQATLEREVRKLKREYTAKIRQTERQLAGQYRKLGEQMANYANARNPQTRELVGGRIEETERHIEGTKQGIAKMNDEMRNKIRAIEVISE